MEDIYQFINKTTNLDDRCMALYLDLTDIRLEYTPVESATADITSHGGAMDQTDQIIVFTL
jgi:hypothetical protein